MESEEKMKKSIIEFKVTLEQKLKTVNQMLELAETNFITDELVPDAFKQKSEPPEVIDHRGLSDEELKHKCSNYPYEGKVRAKLLYLEEIFPYPWRVSDRKEIVIRLEGQETGSKTMGAKASSCCYQLREKGTHKALSFGAKNDTFYGKTEWADANSAIPKFQAKYPILGRIMAEYSEERKKSAVWK
jgi:hypothetical protein